MKKNNFSNLFPSFFVSVIVFSLYYLWFVFLDRRYIFLYGHMHKTPFDAFTTSRHWMTGLVASGIVLICYVLISLIVKRFYNGYKLPDWSSIWKNSCLILALPLFGMLTFTGKPPMPILLSFWILIILFSGLRLALCSASFIINNFCQSIWLFFDGLALMPALTVLGPSIAYGLRRTTLQGMYTLILPLMCVGVGLFWFWIMTILSKRFRKSYPSLQTIFLSGLTIGYLLLPLLHYLGSRPGYIRYITNSDNFFPAQFWFQILTFLAATSMVWLVGKWRKKVNFNPVKTVLVSLILLSLGNFLVTSIVIGRETDVWVCRKGQWIKQGNPPYEKPFKEECKKENLY